MPFKSNDEAVSAVETGNVEALEALAAAGVNLNEIGGKMLVDIAVEKGHANVLSVLAAHGVDLNQAGYSGGSTAAGKGYVDVLQVLAEKCTGELKTFIQELRWDAAIKAAGTGDVEALRMLAATGVNLNEIRAISEQTLAHVAAANRHINVLEFLAENGVREAGTFIQKLQRAAAIKAAGTGDVEALRTLAATGVNLSEIKTDDEQTLAHIAAANRHINVLGFLAEKCTGELKTFIQKLRWDAAIKAAGTGDVEALRTLAATGVNLSEIKTDDEQTLAYIATENGHANVLRALAEHGVDLRQKGDGVRSLARIAVSMGHANALRVLAENGADLTEVRRGRTLACLAAQNEDVDVLQVLADNGVSEAGTFIQKLQRAAAIKAAGTGDVEALRTLAATGVNLSEIKTDDEQTLAHIAAANRHINVLGFLAENGVGEASTFIHKNALKLSLLRLLEPLEQKTKDGGRLQAYPSAKREADSILLALKTAINNYSTQSNITGEQFMQQCRDAMMPEATVHLRQHRNTLGYMFVVIKNFFAALGKMITGDDRGNIRFFDNRTDSTKRVDDLMRAVERTKLTPDTSNPDAPIRPTK